MSGCVCHFTRDAEVVKSMRRRRRRRRRGAADDAQRDCSLSQTRTVSAEAVDEQNGSSSCASHFEAEPGE